MRLPIWRWVISVIALLVLAACAGDAAPATGSDSKAQPTTAAEERLVRIGQAGSPDTLNPGTSVLAEAYTIFDLVYDSMFQLQLDGTYTPELAESYTVSADGTVWTFTLRDGIVFHDGTPLTAADVAFSYNFYQAQTDFPFLNVYTDYFASVEAPDEKTVVVTLTEAIPNMESQLVFLYALPQHIWAPYAETGAADFENLAMIGTGPFKMADYSQNQFTRLEAVTDHYLYRPKVDGLIFQTFENQDALVQALKTGQVDMITEMPKTAVPALRNDPAIQVVTGPPASPSVTDIIFNLVDPENCPPDVGK